MPVAAADSLGPFCPYRDVGTASVDPVITCGAGTGCAGVPDPAGDCLKGLWENHFTSWSNITGLEALAASEPAVAPSVAASSDAA